jgi:hypothetical protein
VTKMKAFFLQFTKVTFLCHSTLVGTALAVNTPLSIQLAEFSQEHDPTDSLSKTLLYALLTQSA